MERLAGSNSSLMWPGRARRWVPGCIDLCWPSNVLARSLAEISKFRVRRVTRLVIGLAGQADRFGVESILRGHYRPDDRFSRAYGHPKAFSSDRSSGGAMLLPKRNPLFGIVRMISLLSSPIHLRAWQIVCVNASSLMAAPPQTA